MLEHEQDHDYDDCGEVVDDSVRTSDEDGRGGEEVIDLDD
jgi:hypothetical protein